jgi:hypothetical protein
VKSALGPAEFADFVGIEVGFCWNFANRINEPSYMLTKYTF